MSILADMRKQKGVTQKDTAAAIGVPLSTYRAWEYGINNPMSDNIIKLASFFNVTTDEVLGRAPLSDPLPKLNPMTHTAPLYGAIAAGVPEEMWELVDEKPVPDQFFENGNEYFYLTVKGDSMNKVVLDGHYALIKRTQEPSNGDVAVVVVNGDEATLKYWYKTPNSLVLSPASYNPEFQDIVFVDGDESNPEIKILGVMVWQMAALD